MIFNSDSYRVDLFINPSLLTVQQNVVQKYLGPSSAKLSFFQTFNYAASSSEAGTLRSLNGRTILSTGETSLEVLSDAGSESEINITSLNLQRDWQGRRYQAGYFSTDSSNLRFSRNFNVLGMRVGTTLDTREDLRQTTGNTIEIFLRQRSRVSLFKDERLVSSRFYEAGNQQLDTSNLPGGAYDVEIVITDGTGERRETRFYSKSSRMPPADQPQFFVEAGSITNRTSASLPERSAHRLIRSGFTRRINNTSSFTLGLTGTNGDSMLEAGWFGMFPSIETSVDLAVTQDDRRALSISLRLPVLISHVLIDHRQVWGSNDGILSPNALLGEELRQSSITTSIPLGSRTLALAARHNSRGSTGSESTYSAIYHLKDRRIGKSTLRSNLQLVRQNDRQTVLFNLGFFASGEHVSINMDTEYNQVDSPVGGDSFGRAATSLGYRNSPNSPTAVFAKLNTRHQADVRTIGLEADAKGRYGRIRGQVERNYANNSGPVYSGNYATSFVATAGGLAFGGQELNRSAIIIDLSESEATRNHFDVVVNNTPVGTALPGRRTVVPVTPYAKYSVNLRARNSGFVSFTDRTHAVTLYPGNAVSLTWQADSVIIVFGNITTADGDAVGNALIHGVAGIATTDDSGRFQAELSPSVAELRFETITHECSVHLPEYTVDAGIAFLPPLNCELARKR